MKVARRFNAGTKNRQTKFLERATKELTLVGEEPTVATCVLSLPTSTYTMQLYGMFRDPLYRQIRRRLRELKDGDSFESCANYLLRSIYPSLAPREGGADAGLDGLIVDKHQSTIQLICTTEQNVLDNLTGSIESNLKAGGKSHACILATSKRLTNPKKRTLEDRAKQLGRPLIQIYDQAGMAQLLYRDAHWLKELLGLTGDPPPLSLFPITTRPFIDVAPVGRDPDLTKFAALEHDIIIVGQPGSGKTHLLFTAAKRYRGRFVVDEDLKLIADGLRTIQPRFLIIDDAHSRLEFLKRLKLLREQIRASFHIVTSCWPGNEDEVCSALGIARNKCHVLEGLRQNQIKEVIESQRIFGPPHLVAEIIHQAQGKPGLAVTLCRLCWEAGSGHDVIFGTALARDVKLSFEPLLGTAATHLLACFSIGGESGMTLEAVAGLLEKNTFEVKRAVEQLAAAGVLDVLQENRIVVQPLRLRQALVRDVFLKPPVIDLGPYLEQTADSASATRVLIEAKALGGVLSDELIRHRLQLLGPTGETTAFEGYAHLGQPEAEWVLDNYPQKFKAVARVTLHTSPVKTVDLLLNSAVDTYNERLSQGWSVKTEDIMPELKHWILSASPNDAEAFRRREILALSLERWPSKNANQIVALRAAELVLSIKHENTSANPGEPMKMTFHFGLVAQNQLSSIAALWPKVSSILKASSPAQSGEIANIFHDWVYPSFHGKNRPKEYETESRSHAHTMIVDLLAAFAGDWTMHHRLRSYADALGLHDSLRSDPIAEILFPSREPLDDWRESEKQQQAAAEKLAVMWSKNDPEEVARILTKAESQSRLAAISCMMPWDRYVCCRISEISSEVEAWTAALFKYDAAAHLIEPFLEKLSIGRSTIADVWISKALESPKCRWVGVGVVVKHCSNNSKLWSLGSQHFKDCSFYIGTLVLRGNVRIENVSALLRFEEPIVASTVASSLWQDRSTPQIPEEILDDWKHAIVENEEDHVLEGVFEEYPDVAVLWIAGRLDGIRDGTRAFWFGSKHDRAVPKAAQVLTREQRRNLIDRLPKSSAVSELVPLLVNRDMELFRYLLSKDDLEDVRLDPLRMDCCFGLQRENVVPDFDETWQQMAIAALDHGYTPENIFFASQSGGYSWSGGRSEMFAARLAPFEKLRNHPDVRLQKVAAIGTKHFSALRDENLAREKRLAIRGEVA